MNNKTDQMDFGLTLPHLPIMQQNFTETSLDDIDEGDDVEGGAGGGDGGGGDGLELCDDSGGGISEDGKT
jgi:hypothetical protein